MAQAQCCRGLGVKSEALEMPIIAFIPKPHLQSNGPFSHMQAVSQAWVIIALDDQIEQNVVKDMWLRKFYG